MFQEFEICFKGIRGKKNHENRSLKVAKGRYLLAEVKIFAKINFQIMTVPGIRFQRN